MGRVVVHPGKILGDSNRLSRVGGDPVLFGPNHPVCLDVAHPFRTRFRVEAGQGVQVVSHARGRGAVTSHDKAT